MQRHLLWDTLVDSLGVSPDLVSVIKLMYKDLQAKLSEDIHSLFPNLCIRLGVK